MTELVTAEVAREVAMEQAAHNLVEAYVGYLALFGEATTHGLVDLDTVMAELGRIREGAEGESLRRIAASTIRSQMRTAYETTDPVNGHMRYQLAMHIQAI